MTNVMLGIALGLGMLSGLLWQGLLELWRSHRNLAGWMAAYFLLLVSGVLWSLNMQFGLETAAHYWFWLLLPLMLAVMRDGVWHRRFGLALSVALTLNLVLCVLQRFGLYVVENSGSWTENATGHIGHIGFGLIYGIWAAWLLHRGWQRRGALRWLAWGLAGWSWVMVFAAQGRAGYIVTVALIFIVVAKHTRLSLRTLLLAGISVLLLGLVAVSSDAGKARMQDTFEKVQGVMEGDVQKADPRWSFWLIGWEAWKQHPVLGVGTGGYAEASARLYEQRPDLVYSGLEKYPPSHPHNMYVQVFSSWGPAGLIVLAGWLLSWIRCGMRMELEGQRHAIVVTLSGVAFAVDSIFSPTPEQHFSGIFLAMMLAFGMARTEMDVKGEKE
ncbi:O-antigen ligase family protein [Mariprofundus ferrinatatus]|nr:O-antigen ligase family protein [Mariprofundus ferrinatatus]